MAVLQNVEPKSVFRFFEEICGIPHGSSNTWAISNYLVDFAVTRKLRYIQDKLGNVMIWKPGTPGYENAAPVMLQGHMDMVCEKEQGTEIDFLKDGLTLRLDGNVISAEETTLGGDDGIAVAFALAILDAKDGEIPHPPLEVVITVDEEIGMLGAAGIDCAPLQAKRMLNLDSEDEGRLLVSCAGGVTVSCHLPVAYEETDNMKLWCLAAGGITGGHSGVEIHREGANASKVLGRIMYQMSRQTHFKLVDVHGGMKDNAIPREAAAVFVCNDDLSELIAKYNVILQQEYRATDPDIRLTLKEVKWNEIAGEQGECGSIARDRCMTDCATQNVVAALMNLPNGVIRMSKDIDGLVQTSLNLGIMKTVQNGTASEVQLSFSVRSSVGSEKDALVEQIESMMCVLGGTITKEGAYPAWEYKQDSSLRELMVDVYEDMYGEKPVIEAIHAGVECGLFAGKIPELDCVSYGPQIDDIHTPSERLYVDSVERTWKYTLEILRRLK